MTSQEAQMKAGEDPDYHTRSMFEELRNGGKPSWDVCAQIIEPERAATYPINIFDPTKTLPFADFPLKKFGEIVLTGNVCNFFAESEQSAFSPTNVVPGWALSPDPSKCSLRSVKRKHVVTICSQFFRRVVLHTQTPNAIVLVLTLSSSLSTNLNTLTTLSIETALQLSTISVEHLTITPL